MNLSAGPEASERAVIFRRKEKSGTRAQSLEPQEFWARVRITADLSCGKQTNEDT